MLALLSLTINGSKHHKGDELPCSRLCWLQNLYCSHLFLLFFFLSACKLFKSRWDEFSSVKTGLDVGIVCKWHSELFAVGNRTAGLNYCLIDTFIVTKLMAEMGRFLNVIPLVLFMLYYIKNKPFVVDSLMRCWRRKLVVVSVTECQCQASTSVRMSSCVRCVRQLATLSCRWCRHFRHLTKTGPCSV